MPPVLFEKFDSAHFDERLSWLGDPPPYRVSSSEGGLVLMPEAATDFWQRTHYGFRADNGHFLQIRAEGNFELTTELTSFPRHQYDQAGLMLRCSADCWLKTSVEFEPDEAHDRLGAVVTNHGYSDWSTQPVSKERRRIWLRIRAEPAAVVSLYSFDGAAWEQARMAHLFERTSATSVAVGLYACSPKQGGYRAIFHSLRVEPLV